MQKNFILFLILSLFVTVSFGQMKCAPGKCGGAMSSSNKAVLKALLSGNNSYKAIDIKAHEYSCAECKMDVVKLDYATQVVKKNGDTYFFDDIGCMVLWLEKNGEDLAKSYVRTVDTHQWIEAEKAHYSRIAPSPMGYGFAAVEADKPRLVSYDKMRSLMLLGKTLRDPEIKKALLTQ